MANLGMTVEYAAETSDYGVKDTKKIKRKVNKNEGDALSFKEYTDILKEIEEQPYWRAKADKEMDYVDGNQLSETLLRMQRKFGAPPAMENLIGPAIRGLQGYEASTRADFRVTPDGEPGGRDVADALNFKLNQAERASKADAACTEAFRPQAAIGVGWVEVSREEDPFRYPYRCRVVSRNEVHWDMRAGSDAYAMRWLRRSRWMSRDLIKRSFPGNDALIDACHAHGGNWWTDPIYTSADQGGMGTGLRSALDEGRSWSIEESRWWNSETRELLVAEMWYRRWVQIVVLKMRNGRVVEYDPTNEMHLLAVAMGGELKKATVARVRQAFWLGPHCLEDRATPYQHDRFPYVRFAGFTEDQTGVPFGYVRDMIYPQDNLNSSISKLRWGMSAVRTTRTKGASHLPDNILRDQISRIDADIVLNQEHMGKPGALFKVERDFQLNSQQFQLLNDSRAAIERTSTITSGFMGRTGSAKSGLQEQLQVEQSNQGLALMMSNFREARAEVGELLLAMIIEDIGQDQETVVIEGDAVTENRTVVLNQPEVDPATGMPYLSNDLQRIRLKVSLEDVPSTSSFRAQQLNAISELGKSLPQNIQEVITPYMVALMDTPYQREIVEALKAASERMTPDQVEERVKKEVQDALDKAGMDLKRQELSLKYSPDKVQAEIDLLVAKRVREMVQAIYASMQSGAQIAQIPMVAPLADEVMKASGYQAPNPGGVDPNFPVPAQAAASNIRSPYIQGQGAVPGSEQLVLAHQQPNTDPTSPALGNPATGMRGIETARASDNFGGAAP